jgi:hypothetical protein
VFRRRIFYDNDGKVLRHYMALGGDNDACVYATAPDGAQSYDTAGTYTILKNSVLGVYIESRISGSYQMLVDAGLITLYKATGDLTIWLLKGL